MDNRPNKWCIRDGKIDGGNVLGSMDLVSALKRCLKDNEESMTAFLWSSTKQGDGFWDNYHDNNTIEGKQTLHKMIRALTYTKPFNRKDWL